MKKIYLVIALVLLTVGCARIKPASKAEEVTETTEEVVAEETESEEE